MLALCDVAFSSDCSPWVARGKRWRGYERLGGQSAGIPYLRSRGSGTKEPRRTTAGPLDTPRQRGTPRCKLRPAQHLRPHRSHLERRRDDISVRHQANPRYSDHDRRARDPGRGPLRARVDLLPPATPPPGCSRRLILRRSLPQNGSVRKPPPPASPWREQQSPAHRPVGLVMGSCVYRTCSGERRLKRYIPALRSQVCPGNRPRCEVGRSSLRPTNRPTADDGPRRAGLPAHQNMRFCGLF
jgi:hypothetical protein